jgi:hypothetical protein
MQIPPLQQERFHPRREISGDRSILNPYRTFRSTIASMEVRRLVVPVVHGDHDSEETADLGHGVSLRGRFHLLVRLAILSRAREEGRYAA